MARVPAHDDDPVAALAISRAVTVDADPAQRLVLVPIGRLDLRAARALEQAWHIPARERRALHIAVDQRELWELAAAWMERAASSPLFTVESDGGPARTIARVVECELDAGYDEVIVLVGRLGLGRRWHRLLHDRTADAIGRAVSSIPGVVTALVTVATT